MKAQGHNRTFRIGKFNINSFNVIFISTMDFSHTLKN